jgi:TonB family protein
MANGRLFNSTINNISLKNSNFATPNFRQRYFISMLSKNSLCVLTLLLISTITHAQKEKTEYTPVTPPDLVVKETAIEYNEPHPFMVLDEIPQFKECKEVSKEEAKACFEEQLKKHIRKNLKYPAEAKKNNIQAKVIVQFIINQEGKVTDLRAKSPKGAELLEAEAIRVIKKLPKFIPGKQRGRVVNTSYAVPILFKM